jgi:hypothetical protein
VGEERRNRVNSSPDGGNDLPTAPAPLWAVMLLQDVWLPSLALDLISGSNPLPRIGIPPGDHKMRNGSKARTSALVKS